MEAQEKTMVLTRHEAANELKVHVNTVDRLIRTKELTARRIGRRVVVPRQSLVAFLRRDH